MSIVLPKNRKSIANAPYQPLKTLIEFTSMDYFIGTISNFSKLVLRVMVGETKLNLMVGQLTHQNMFVISRTYV